jgi:hypothetical protein
VSARTCGTRAFGPGGPDGGGAAASSVFAQPTGTENGEAFAWFASGNPGTRLAAAVIAAERALDDPRTLAALLARLSSDPNPMVRKLIASRMPIFDDRPPRRHRRPAGCRGRR